MKKMNWKLHRCHDCGRIPEVLLVDDSFVCFVCYQKYYTMGERKKSKKNFFQMLFWFAKNR